MMLTNIFSYVLDALTYQGIVIVAWVAVALAHVWYLRRSHPRPRARRVPPRAHPGLQPRRHPGLGHRQRGRRDPEDHRLGDEPVLRCLGPTADVRARLRDLHGRHDGGEAVLVREAARATRPSRSTTRARPACAATACDRSYIAQEMDRDPTAGHQAICAECATGPAFFTAARHEALRLRRGAGARSGTVTAEINCDMGEALGLWSLGDDAALMPLISAANVACGFHAGDPVVMRDRSRWSSGTGSSVGAHPGYPDLQGFGRHVMRHGPRRGQRRRSSTRPARSRRSSTPRACRSSHLKPHGALYGRAAQGTRPPRTPSPTPPRPAGPGARHGGDRARGASTRAAAWTFVAEYYADLEYADDGSLIITRRHAALRPRARPGARRAGIPRRRGGHAVGREIPMRADTVCLHSDTPGVTDLARAVQAALRDVDPSDPMRRPWPATKS